MEQSFDLTEFINALQLSISTQFRTEPNLQFLDNSDIIIVIEFKESPSPKEKFERFLKMFGNRYTWNSEANTLEIAVDSQKDIEDITKILMLTRLEEASLQKLHQQSSDLAKWLNVFSTDLTYYSSSIEDSLRKLVFDTAKRNNISVAELARRSGLSYVSLHRFKNGEDIRLSSLVKIFDALGLNRDDIASEWKKWKES